MTKSAMKKFKKIQSKKEPTQGEVYVTNAKDFETAKEVALVLAPKLFNATDGNYLIQMQVLDILQDNLALQAIQAKNKLKQEQADAVN